jgi:hypothetical protein
VDASATHVGATLQQQERGEAACRPLGFFSKKLDPAQQKYSAFDRHLLEGRRFAVYTDHKPLTHAISCLSDPWTARQCRQLAYVAEYTSDICHIAGADNIVADTLSRPPGHVPRAGLPSISSPSFPAGGQSAGNGQRATSSPIRPGPQSPASAVVTQGAVPTEQAPVMALVPVTMSPAVDYTAMANRQPHCALVQQTQASAALQVQSVNVQGAQLLCDVSRGSTRPLVPAADRQTVFWAMHGLAHPGIRPPADCYLPVLCGTAWPEISTPGAGTAKRGNVAK